MVPGDGLNPAMAHPDPAAPPPPAWYPQPPFPPSPPSPPSALPVVPREYHEFYRTPRLQWWHPLVALLMFAGTAAVAVTVVSVAAVLYDLAEGNLVWEELAAGRLEITPMLFLANNVALALAIPLAWAAHRAVLGQRAGWLFSIVGRLRWGLLGRFMLIALVFYLALFVVETALTGLPENLAVGPDTWFLLFSILLTTPLQSAGEEVAIRGLMARSIGSWFPARRVGLVVSTAITAVVFMALHGAGDPWLNAHYLWFGVVACVLTWKTGGLEAPIALHVVNNLTGLSLVPFLGLDGLFDRDAGVGSPLVLVQAALLTAAAAAILWQAKRLGLSTSTAPAALAGTVEGSEPPGSTPGWG